MLLNSSKLIAKWTARDSGICLYFANSATQSVEENGGTMPTIGCHSIIERPERVSRVTPPTTTIRRSSPQQRKSHAATGVIRRCSLAAREGLENAVLSAEIDNARFSQVPTS